MFDENPVHVQNSTDLLPLYSSFAKDKILKIPNLPDRKLQPGADVVDRNDETRNSVMYSSLHNKKDNMFRRSLDRFPLGASKSFAELTSSPKAPLKSRTLMNEVSNKNLSLLKKCALQGIRSSSFKNE
jgi:hypothetical protein